MTAMGRKPYPEPERRDKRLVTYVTAAEKAAVSKLVQEGAFRADAQEGPRYVIGQESLDRTIVRD